MAGTAETDPAGVRGDGTGHPGDRRLILAPVDFSPLAGVAMEHCLLLARLLEWRVRLLHVYRHLPGREFGREHAKTMGTSRKMQETIRLWREQYGLDADLLETEGNLFAMIASTAAQLTPGLMVLGTHGKSGLQQIYGSYALRILLDAPCPVLVVGRSPATQGHRRILATIHNDIDNPKTGEWIGAFGIRENAVIHLVPVIETGRTGNEETSAMLSSLTEQLGESHIEFLVSPPVSPSDFSSAIINYAETNDIDLIIAPSLPPEGVAAFDHADWTERLMFNRAGIPVMFINRP